MARKIPANGVRADFSTDQTQVYLTPSVEGVRVLQVATKVFHGFWQFKGWGSPIHMALNGSIIDGQLMQLFEIDPDDPDLQEK